MQQYQNKRNSHVHGRPLTEGANATVLRRTSRKLQDDGCDCIFVLDPRARVTVFEIQSKYLEGGRQHGFVRTALARILQNRLVSENCTLSEPRRLTTEQRQRVLECDGVPKVRLISLI